ncbi:MAG: tRNA pseudouridine(38-40) synthase TruA [Spirochaetes bacterium]|nr:tRNA pseudouridine(38-40) synthase TruA [Spirochaetota bacterium]
MHRYKLVLEYDGTRFRGWQKQKNARTIQETLTAAAERFLGAPADIQGAGRTDAGVHALGQTAHLETSREIDPAALREGINGMLPESISILSAESAAPRFHARHHAVSRSYLYLISKRRTVFGSKYAWWVPDRLDCDIMRRTLDVFRGFHDFASFTDRRMEKGSSTRAGIDSLLLEEFGDIIAIRVVGRHFLWKMVRRMTGVTVAAGRGDLTIRDIEEMLVSYSETPKKSTAPPHGLFLEKVLYEGDTLPDIKAPPFFR